MDVTDTVVWNRCNGREQTGGTDAVGGEEATKS